MAFGDFLQFFSGIESNWIVALIIVHESVGGRVIDLKNIVKIDHIIFWIVTAVWLHFEDDEGWELIGDLNLKGSFSNISSLEQPLEISFGFNMSENNFLPECDLFSLFRVKNSLKGNNLSFSTSAKGYFIFLASLIKNYLSSS